MKGEKNLLEEYHITGLQTFEEEVEGPLIFINDMKLKSRSRRVPSERTFHFGESFYEMDNAF